MSDVIGQQRRKLLRTLPSIDAILRHPSLSTLIEQRGRNLVREAARSVLDQIRANIRAGAGYETPEVLIGEIQAQIQEHLQRAEQPSLRRVINATGVVIHTNLGRAPLAEEALRAIKDVSAGYSNLEYDLSEGQRGHRETHCEALLTQLLGCEAALVVNNNAAAVLLVLNTLAEAGEVIVSRGELVEIGGSFRIPDIMAKSNAVLCEVGTTNRTRIADYERAINERTRLLLRVHRSNFRLTGFTEQPSLEDLVGLGRNRGLPCFEDLGSGCLVDMEAWGILDEPLVQHSLAAGVDVCSFSGDKLLGGPQAGVIVGKKVVMDLLRRNPLMRAVRPDKLTYAALEATLRLYRQDRPETAIPVLNMLSQSAEDIRRRARRFLNRARRVVGNAARFRLKPGLSVTGGGSAPGSRLETVLIVVESSILSAVEVEQRLRMFGPPIITRIEEDHVVLDLRTVKREEENALLAALRTLFDLV